MKADISASESFLVNLPYLHSSPKRTTITTRGQDILINKPSGQIDRFPLVSDDQLALKKYTQIVQNMLTAGILIIVGLLLVPLTFSGRGPVDGSVLFTGFAPGLLGRLDFT